YRALDPLIERTVAIKTIRLDLSDEERAPFEDRFLREAKSAGRLSHQNIVTIYDVGEAGDIAYIAMEYLKGQSLKEILDQHGPLPLDLALDTAIQMADALAFAHLNGIVHRDVKPGNVIVLEGRGAIKLTDFGIAHIHAHNETRHDVLTGSPRYMAPEQITGKPIDGRTDVFSAGVVLYEMLTGQAPFTAPDLHVLLYRIVNEAPVPASRLRPDVPSELDSLLVRCLAKQPDQRPASAQELSRELKKIAARSSAETGVVANARRPRQLAVFAFFIPVLVFLILSVGVIVIEHFIPPAELQPTVYAPPPQLPTVTPTPPEIHGTHRGGQRTASTRGSSQGLHGAPSGQNSSPGTPDYYLTKLDKELAELKLKRAEMLGTYTEIHPDVVMLDRKMQEIERARRNYLRKNKDRDSESSP
ncbi:MAG: protein kinase domain-containing protein, partial [Thiobacillaceae bacterium]